MKINRVDECHILNLDIGNVKGVKDINMVFNEMSQNSSLELKLQGQGVTPHRDAQEHRFYSFGDNMTLKRFRTYIIKIRENTFFEEDLSQTCRNYPASEFSRIVQLGSDAFAGHGRHSGFL